MTKRTGSITLILSISIFGAKGFAAATPTDQIDRAEICARMMENAAALGEPIGPENVTNSLYLPTHAMKLRLVEPQRGQGRVRRVPVALRAWFNSFDEHDEYEVDGAAAVSHRQLLFRLRRISALRRRLGETKMIRFVVRGRERIDEYLRRTGEPLQNLVLTGDGQDAGLDFQSSFMEAMRDLIGENPANPGNASVEYHAFLVKAGDGSADLTPDSVRARGSAGGLFSGDRILVHQLFFFDGREWVLHVYGYRQPLTHRILALLNRALRLNAN